MISDHDRLELTAPRLSHASDIRQSLARGLRGFWDNETHKRLASAQLVVVLAATVWVTHFFYSSHFGLYEDDWNRVARTYGMSLPDFWRLARHCLDPVFSQGRPFHPFFIFLFSFAGFKLGGLPVIYEIAFGILLINAGLFYLFLQRAFCSSEIALLGTLAFCVFPADTTQPYLTHALGVAPSITFLLIALHLYLRGKSYWSYVAVTLVLLTYETIFPVFAVAPLIARRSRSETFKHFFILGSIVLVAAVVRASSAEPQVSVLRTGGILLGLTNVILGPIVCLAMYVYRPFMTLVTIGPQVAVPLFIVFTACLWLLLSQLRATGFREMGRRLVENGTVMVGPPSHDLSGSGHLRTLHIGVLMLVFAYPLTFTTTGVAVAGRGTRVHAAAILGASIICAWTCSRILKAFKDRRWNEAGPVAIAAFITLLAGFGLNVQRDYVVGWLEERRFWTDLVNLCPDLDDGDVIFLEPSGLRDTRQLLFLRHDLTGVPDTRQIKSLDVLHETLPGIFDMPASWRDPPRVYRLPINWKEQIFLGDNRLKIISIEAGYAYSLPANASAPSSKVIFLDTEGGRLTRLTILINAKSGERMLLKPESIPPHPLPTSPLYTDVIKWRSPRPVQYLVE